MTYLIIAVIIAAVYFDYRVTAILKGETEALASLKSEMEEMRREIRSVEQLGRPPLAYGWFDDGWPVRRTADERNGPLENPSPHRAPDEYSTQMFVAEYRSIPNPHERKEFLRQLFNEGVWMKPGLLDAVYADENAYVRAWAAGHLETDFKDYADPQNPLVIRDYEVALLRDPQPIVRAALWSNPRCNHLPWSMIRIAEDWKERLRKMSQIERLGLMRNPDLSARYVVALLETPSNDLNMTREDHAQVVWAAAINPSLIDGSRRTGRESWVGGGEGNAPFKEYGRMWELCLDSWLDQSVVPYVFLKYIQTTPEVKLAAYKRLLEKREGSDHTFLREEVIRSCGPFVDAEVLRLAWEDPEEKCRKIARERVGEFTSIVGVVERKTG